MGCGASSEASAAREPNQVVPVSSAGDDYDDELAMELGDQRIDKAGNIVNKYDVKESKPEEDTGAFELEEGGETEQFMAVKPWIGALKAPSNPPVNNATVPDQRLELEYVNGYRCEDSRSNLFYTNRPGVIAYFTAAIGIVLDVKANKQTFFGAGMVGENECHNDDIESMDICPERKLAVTGQRGPNPLVLVWDMESKQILARLPLGRGNRVAKCVKFSKDGSKIFATDEHNDHHVHVFDWASSSRVGYSNTGGDTIMDLDTGSGAFAAVAACKAGLVFFTADGQASKGLYGSTARVDMLAVRFLSDGNRCVSGAINGCLYLWNGKQASKQIQIHNGAVHCVSVVNGTLFTSGAKDKLLKVFDEGSLSEKESHQLSNHARAVDYSNNNILVGTRSGQIIEIVNGEQNIIMNGHSTGETWGLDIDSQGNIVTSGDDNKIIVFDPKTNKAVDEGVVNTVAGQKKKIGGASTLSLYPPNQCSRAVAVNKHNGHVAIASNNGDLSIRAGVNQLNESVFDQKISREWIEVLTYSPDGSRLAAGSHDNKIYIYDVNNGYNLIATCGAHQSFITSVDWSTDGNFLQSNCGAYEYLFFDANSGKQIQGGATQFKDEKWATFTCKLGWPVQGVFPPATDGSHVNGVDRSVSGKIFATGDDWGFLNLYRNPCLKGNKAKSYRAHSSHVVRVMFDANDKYIYSVGGYDRTLMKWKVI